MLDYELVMVAFAKLRDEFSKAAAEGLNNEMRSRDASLGNIRYIAGQHDGITMVLDRMENGLNKLRED